MTYLARFLTRTPPQSEPIPGSAQVPNSAGGYAWAVDDWARLDRFLILGAEGGSYYASERKLTLENAEATLRCIEQDGARAVARIVDVSEAGRAPKNDPAIFALALAASLGDEQTRKLALAALPRVCRIGTHLFHFAQFVDGMRGWGRGLRQAVRDWYWQQHLDGQLAYQLVKYQARDGWSHRDLLRLAHPKATDETYQTLLHWAVKGWPGVGDEPHPDQVVLPVWAFERAKRAGSAHETARLIREYDLPRECIPTEQLTERFVWEALLERMPLTATIRNLATMTRVGLFDSAETVGLVADRITNEQALKRARVHPIAVLAALTTYQSGHGARGQHTWEPVAKLVDALDAAFYASFGNVEPTGKKTLLALDVSSSMNGGTVAGVPGLTLRVASVAMAMVTTRVEPDYQIVAFTRKGESFRSGSGLTVLDFSPRQRLDDLCQATAALPFGGTDCALPMLHAVERKIPFESFAVYTDNETWAGEIHPAQALRRHREQAGVDARLVVVGMVSNGFSIADPDDAGMLDVVGFDTATPQVISDFAG